MRIWPAGTLRRIREWCDSVGTLLIADEVMTGFGRTGKMFACEHEEIDPDIYVFAKGLTGGYLPLSLTLVSNEVYAPFCGSGSDATLFYGHSYTGNALGCAAALASLEVFRTERTIESLPLKMAALQEGLASISKLQGVQGVRRCGMIGAFDLSDDSRLAEQVCLGARERGLLTRHIRNTVVLMPPLVISIPQLQKALNVLKQSIQSVITSRSELLKPTPATS
jgi:adenosylmethionine-8-amino-7-oxononanoate aminotransferase